MIGKMGENLNPTKYLQDERFVVFTDHPNVAGRGKSGRRRTKPRARGPGFERDRSIERVAIDAF
jgi:hypothetical protein